MNAIQVRPFLVTTACVFALVAVAHVLRAATGAEMRINGWDVPVTLSWGAGVVTAMLCAWAARLAGAVGR